MRGPHNNVRIKLATSFKDPHECVARMCKFSFTLANANPRSKDLDMRVDAQDLPRKLQWRFAGYLQYPINVRMNIREFDLINIISVPALIGPGE